MDVDRARRLAVVVGIAAAVGTFVAVAPLRCGLTGRLHTGTGSTLGFYRCQGLLAFQYRTANWWQPTVSGAIVGFLTGLGTWLGIRRPSLDGGERWILGPLLAFVTLVLLTSIGGAMAYGFPLLFPLQWYAAAQSGRWMGGVWIALAALSATEAAFMYQYMLTASELWIFPTLVPCVVIVVLVATTRRPIT